MIYLKLLKDGIIERHFLSIIQLQQLQSLWLAQGLLYCMTHHPYLPHSILSPAIFERLTSLIAFGFAPTKARKEECVKMGLRSQLNDVSSGSIRLLLVALIANCVNSLPSFLFGRYSRIWYGSPRRPHLGHQPGRPDLTRRAAQHEPAFLSQLLP